MSTSIQLPKAPSRMVIEPVLSDQEFEELCAANDGVRFERTSEGAIVVNPPTGWGSEDLNAEIITQLRTWVKSQHIGGIALGSSVGIFLPDGSSKSPDAAYLTLAQVSKLTPESRKHFLHIVPAFVIELLSETDRLAAAKRKMELWIASGAELGWLIDPKNRKVYVYEQRNAPYEVVGDHITAGEPVLGFKLDLTQIWLTS
jgi:Uma2 family endonuclease